MADKRTCNGCTLCCKIVSVLELEKPSMTWCQHCDIGKGCKIYDSKPKSCKSFDCLWLVNEWIPEELRPDRCNIVFEGLYGVPVVLALLNEGHDDAHLEEPAQLFIHHLVTRAKHSVIIFRYGKSREPLICLAPGATLPMIGKHLEWAADQNLRRFAEQERISFEEAQAREDAFRAARGVIKPEQANG